MVLPFLHCNEMQRFTIKTIVESPTQTVLNTRTFVLPIIFLIKLLFCLCDAKHDYIQLNGKIGFSFCTFSICILFLSKILGNCDALGNHLKITIRH